ncbi:hypothetical protein FRD82_15845, partial [Mycobacterium tuberculosis]
AQDAMAMYGYAGSSATATKVTPFAPPPNTTSPSAAATQLSAVAKAAGTSAGAAQSAIAELIAHLSNTLLGLTSPLSSALTAAATPGWLEWFINWYLPISQLFYNTVGLPYFAIGIGNSLITSWRALGWIGPEAAEAAAAAPAAVGAAVGGTGPVSAGLGNAATIGKLSLPPNWAGASPSLAPTVGSASAPLVSDIVEQPEAGAAGNLLGGMPLAGSGTGTGGAGPRYGFRVTVMSRPPFAG